jgi:hypothetical protein
MKNVPKNVFKRPFVDKKLMSVGSGWKSQMSSFEPTQLPNVFLDQDRIELAIEERAPINL